MDSDFPDLALPNSCAWWDSEAQLVTWPLEAGLSSLLEVQARRMKSEVGRRNLVVNVLNAQTFSQVAFVWFGGV